MDKKCNISTVIYYMVILLVNQFSTYVHHVIAASSLTAGLVACGFSPIPLFIAI